MGTNIHALAHRLTALSMACLASTGFIFCTLSGFGCSFVQIQAMEGRSIGTASGKEFENLETAYLGVKCLSGIDASFYPSGGSSSSNINSNSNSSSNSNDYDYEHHYDHDGHDRLWDLSRIFLWVGLVLGAATTLFAWLLSSCVRPTSPRWGVLSILAACSAVFQIPIFLVFESDNCNFDVFRQTCKLSTGAYLNIISVSIWIIMTIWVQYLNNWIGRNITHEP